jgi:hypothetical protein
MDVLSKKFVLIGTLEKLKEKGRLVLHSIAPKQISLKRTPLGKAGFDVAAANFGICHTHQLFDNRRRTPCGSTGSSCRDTWPLR